MDAGRPRHVSCRGVETMNEESVPRLRPGRTGKHVCVQCLSETPAEDYFEYDFHCRKCAARTGEYPLASTPGKAESGAND